LIHFYKRISDLERSMSRERHETLQVKFDSI